ncbi:flavin reductase family protein [Streptomyces sp. NBC_00669]|uniref:flavin reductase family protein n=1 Tax=Streptomyces sp. NBC_00669 TaxID=2976011 RepID=UPI002E381830|nr:flavin reductase family protein [Streptomyces sp. NBC_00669]
MTTARTSVQRPGPTAAAQPDPAVFRQVLGFFCTGVTVITAADRGRPAPVGRTAVEPVGFTCQSFGSLSLDPPLVVFSASRDSTSWSRIRSSGAFCVNVLGRDQEALCRAFAVSGADKFAGVEWSPGPATGSPRIAGSVAWVECVIEAVHPGGDHSIVVGGVRALDIADSPVEPLLFYRSAFRGMAPSGPGVTPAPP